MDSALAAGVKRENERKRGKAEREQEVVLRLPAVGVGRPQRGHDRLAGEDHHVPDLLEQVLGREECPIGYVANHAILLTAAAHPSATCRRRPRSTPSRTAAAPVPGAGRARRPHTPLLRPSLCPRTSARPATAG